MNKKDLEYFKDKLVAEKARLEEELGGIAHKDPSMAGGWEPTTGNIEVDSADENEVADKLEELEENSGIAHELEDQLTEVQAALAKIEKGTYGICEACEKPIERERLEANPSAKTSLKHGH